MNTCIHTSAIVEKGAELDDGVEIGAFSYIGAHVRLHRGVKIGRNAIIDGHTEIGEDSRIFSQAKIGIIPQDLKYKNEPSRLIMGKRNHIREGASIEIGTEKGGMKTYLGDDNLLMINSHIAHDTIVGNHLVMGMCAGTAGHVELGSFVHVASLCAIHQFTRIGDHAYIGLSAVINRDVAPFCLVNGNSQMIGINLRGLKRLDYSLSTIKDIMTVYESLWASRKMTFACRLELLDKHRDKYDIHAQKMIDFALQPTKQGYLMPYFDENR